LKSSLSWNGVACKPICNPIVSNRLSILMHFALGHLLQTLHCPHRGPCWLHCNLQKRFAQQLNTAHCMFEGPGVFERVPESELIFSIAQEYCCGFGVTCHRWNTLKSSQNSWTWYFSPTFVVFCGILAVGNSCAEILQNSGTEPPQSSVSRHFRAEAATLRRNSVVVVAPPASTGLCASLDAKDSAGEKRWQLLVGSGTTNYIILHYTT
jgi:hypothetical protein